LSIIFKILNKLNIDNIILKVILLFPISTIIQGFSIFSPINKVLTALLMGFLLLKVMMNLVERYEIKILALSVAVFSSSYIGILLCDNFNFNINNLFHYLLFGLFAIYLIFDHEKFKENLDKEKKLIFYIISIWTIIVIISFFFKSSYISTWGDSFYFKSFSEGVPHRFASSCCLILALTFILIKDIEKINKIKIMLFALLVLPTVCVLLSGARVYLIIAVLTLVIIYHNECKSEKIFWLTAIPIGVMGILAIMISPMGDKMIATATNEHATNLLAAFTSGRSEFWVYDMDAYFVSDLYYKIFGSGVSFVFDVNRKMIGNPIYAHNDYINILMTYGLLGLIEYFVCIIWLVKTFYEKNKIKSIVGALSLFGIYFASAFLNGFYVYPCTLLAMPILMYCAQSKKDKKI
jgi:hypothetical protein